MNETLSILAHVLTANPMAATYGEGAKCESRTPRP